MLFIQLFLLVAFSWKSWIQRVWAKSWRKWIAFAGLVALTTGSLLILLLMEQIARSKGGSSASPGTEVSIYLSGMVAFLCLCFAHKSTRWVGCLTAILLPISASVTASLY